jgi:hypothetical protein
MSVTNKGYNSLKISGINLTSVQRKKKKFEWEQIFDRMVLRPVKTSIKPVLCF